MNLISHKIQTMPKFLEYINKIKGKNSQIQVSGLSDVLKTCFAFCTKDAINRPICIVTYNEMQAKKIIKDLSYFCSNVKYFTKREIASYDYVAESKDLPYERIEVLNRIMQNKVDIVVTTIEAIMQNMVCKDDLYKNVINLKIGLSFPLEELKEKLISLGYERCDMVESRGTFCIRGGIVDIAVNDTEGIRIEFWGDDIDSIRMFKMSSQRSTEMREEFIIYPAHEFIPLDNLENIVKDIKKYPETLKLEKNQVSDTSYLNLDGKLKLGYIQKIEENLMQDIEQINSGDYISKIDKYFNSFYKKQNSFLDYLSDDFLIIFDEMTKINQRIENIIIENNHLIKNLIEKTRIVPQSILNISNFNLNTQNKQVVILERQDIVKRQDENTNNDFTFFSRDVAFFKTETDLLINEIKSMINKNKTVVILAGNEANINKICSLLTEKDVRHKFVQKLDEKQEDINAVLVAEGAFSTGFEFIDANLEVLSSEEFFSNNTVRRKLSKAFKQGEKVVFADLKIGDYVVHRFHGIGQFVGVNTIEADGVIKDYIKLKYRDDDILYVPTNNLDIIRKYIGDGDATPKINKLGGKEWLVTTKKVKSNLREVAKELIELYAKRQKARGFAFSKDTEWQKQFEDSFKYQETDDQLRCIEETKKDMESPKPMDRLLCGDVGYGKTEVAIRAAFKACMDSKQVAYLVPTTVLAKQQYEEFKRRMEPFGIKVDLLNRFRTKKEQEETLRDLKIGKVDVVIGTHRILSKDIVFKDLGLLIIDEEHRFGVKAKEKIKLYKNTIDVLTMTATPIPRTLHMSIVGVRDMSVIYEPPQNRKPVQTYVLEYDDEVIKEAITRELERNGQVFYLFNNVENIENKALFIQNLVPESHVRICTWKNDWKPDRRDYGEIYKSRN